MEAFPSRSLSSMLYDAVRIGIRERLKKHRVNDGEDRGVGADAQRKGGDGGDSEAGTLDEEVQRVFHVVPKFRHEALRLGCALPNQ